MFNAGKILFFLVVLSVLSANTTLAVADNTYKYKVSGENEELTLTVKFAEGGFHYRVKTTYTFSSLPNYHFYTVGGSFIADDCNCKGCGCSESTCGATLIHPPECLAHGIFQSSLFLNPMVSESRQRESRRIRPLVITLADIMRPLAAHFNRHRESAESGIPFPPEDILERTLARLQRSSQTASSGNGGHFGVHIDYCPGNLFQPHAYFVSTSAPDGVTVLIPPAALANSPDSQTPDILPLAYITNPEFTFSESGDKEAIEFDVSFLHMSDGIYYPEDRDPNRDMSRDDHPPSTASGRYSINLSTGAFTLTITRQDQSLFQVTGNISPDNELEAPPAPVRDERSLRLSQMLGVVVTSVSLLRSGEKN